MIKKITKKTKKSIKPKIKKNKKKFISGWRLSLFGLLCIFVLYGLHPYIFENKPQDEIGELIEEEVLSAPQDNKKRAENIAPKTETGSKEEESYSSSQVVTKADDIAYLINALNAEGYEEPFPSEEETKTEAQNLQAEAEQATTVETSHLSDEHTYQLYEEELPDNIIDENMADNSEVHYQHKSIREIPIQIMPRPHKKKIPPTQEKLIAIVIDDMGVNVRRTKDIISLEAPLTSSFLTYGPHLEKQIEEARAAGHEIMAHVPMQPHKDLYTAPDGLTVNMSDEELTENFETMLKKFPKIQGINNHMGSKFTENRRVMSDIMQVLKKHNLFFLDSKTTSKSVGREVAAIHGVRYATRHVFLDNNNEKNYILRQLCQTEKIAEKNGYAVAIGHPKSQTYAALKEWLPTLKAKGIKLVHMSEIVELRN